MSEIATRIGLRLRAYRQRNHLSQEALAELAGLHPTYIGQLERGEKNATLETVEKVCLALHLPLHQLFENMDAAQETDCATQCYDLILAQPANEQKLLLSLLKQIIAYR